MTRKAELITDYHAGDSLTLKVTAREQDGAAVDLTGASVEYGLSDSPAGSTIFTKTTSGSGIEIVDATKGRFDVHIDPADTESLDGLYYHEAELTDSQSRVSTLFVGELRVSPSMV